ncbi:acetyl/propionyl/methylcrotonyl-CoA carboxylase subunit alpha [Corynebacterium ulceribovis]|uniref:acetyl/propionyl/methylcrotonyl-CoA carboxylase subunit alpha n=1 Tax=Corynebacterium ulceribovis TaxID=487732 RepID=UPI000368C8B1|nr:acetyl/propionyl/methylcrotonyl-CoA carboxylase subunit alpha [Corynebacterium ulceribovis]
MNHITTVLVANRGEIACRVIRTLREQGITSVAVYSDADAGALHVREADLAVHIGPSPARESYLVIDKIIDAAKRSGAQAIHPGYGFLSENAAFAKACEDNDIIFMGPPASAIETMGDKISARAAVESRDVPTVPGISRVGLTDEDIINAAPDIGFPVLIKPSAGGGGKGMHRVEKLEDLAAALVTARREAASAFGDDSLFLEHFVDTPRHIEVQIVADSHGNVIHLGERECSLQRRHQKVIEEAPSALLDEKTRAEIGEAACDAARSVGYVGAGTVEFIVSAKNPERFFFMEMNTRLQVEHPVTEMVTGIDLVELQLAVARGEELPVAQEDVTLTGHSIEARVYAEDPENGFLPTGGTVTALAEPSGTGIRVDSGIVAGSEVTSLYDPMLMKVIAHGADRDEAMDRLDRALANTIVAGVGVNTDFCRFLLADEEVRAGCLDTGLLDRVAPDYVASSVPDQALVAAAMAWLGERWPTETSSPWAYPDGWRPGRHIASHIRLDDGKNDQLVAVEGTPSSATVIVGKHVAGLDKTDGDDADQPEPREYAASIRRNGERWQLTIDGLASYWTIDVAGEDIVVGGNDGTWALKQKATVAGGAGGEADADGIIAAPMPGTVIALSVADGDTVTAGQPVLVVEAMKMEHTLTAGIDGVVSIKCAAGQQVPAGEAIAVITPAEDN